MAFKDMIHNYYNGDPDKRDFSENDLPNDRVELFKAMMKVRLGGLIGLNLRYVISWTLAAVWVYTSIKMLTTNGAEAFDPGYLVIDTAIFALLIIITGPFDMGIAYVTRNWTRDEHADISDQFQYVRKYFGVGLLHGLVYSVFLLLSVTSFLQYLNMMSDSWLSYIPCAIVLMMFMIGDLASMLMPMMLITYEGSYFFHLKNALVLTIVELPRAAGIRLLTMILPLISIGSMFFYPSAFNVCMSLTAALYIAVMPAVNKMLIAAFANYVCETHINSKIGEPTRIGLRPIDKA